ncbi:PAC2 family protein [Candidatus Woesearchaeota archaeon]|nr:PAC2 family protein [Candidatus Woesearchaeota archaeon]
MVWEIKQISKPKIKNPVLIEGLPGMGNVGKIAVDFMIDSLGAKKLMEIHSYDYPHLVFVNEENLLELPVIEVYYKNVGNKTLLFLAGDVQPLDERACYEFCSRVLDTFEKAGGQEIIALGGIAMQKIPRYPKVYCTANGKRILEKYAARFKSKNL